MGRLEFLYEPKPEVPKDFDASQSAYRLNATSRIPGIGDAYTSALMGVVNESIAWTADMQVAQHGPLRRFTHKQPIPILYEGKPILELPETWTQVRLTFDPFSDRMRAASAWFMYDSATEVPSVPLHFLAGRGEMEQAQRPPLLGAPLVDAHNGDELLRDIMHGLNTLHLAAMQRL